MKHAVLSVTNDLFTDTRVDKVARFLIRNGYEVTLVGRRYADSPQLPPRPYHTHRMRLLFRRGMWFYAEYQFRLFLYLLWKSCDTLIANDLDTLLPNFWVSRIRRKRLVYDSHEYFCGEITVLNNPKAQKVWSAIERYCFPKLQTVITVSASIVQQYEKEYGIRPYLVRNIPPAKHPPITETKTSLGMSDKTFNILMQGSGINAGRGGEELVEAMTLLPHSHLFIVGDGTMLPTLKKQVETLHLTHQVTFVPRQTPEKLFNYTALADVGMALDKDICPNLRYSLPNKVFEYMQAGTPQIVSNLVERATLIRQYGMGIVLDNMTPEAIAAAVTTLQTDKAFYQQCKANCQTAAQALTWEHEEETLQQIYL